MNHNRLLVLLLILWALAGCRQEADIASTPGQQASGATPGRSSDLTDSTTAYPAADAYPAPGGYEQVLSPAYPGAMPIDSGAIVTRPPDSALDPDRPVPTPETGTAVVTGHVVSATSGEPYVNVPVRLAQVYYNAENVGGFILDGANSPGALTDINGRFIFTAVDPVEYVVVVGDVETGNYDIIESGRADEAQVWQMPAGEITDVGTLRVELPTQ